MLALPDPLPFFRQTPLPVSKDNSATRQGRVTAYYFFTLLYALTLPTLKLSLGFEIRAGQLVLLFGFGLLMLRDLQMKQVRWGVLCLVLGLGIFLSGISLLETYPKIKQSTFIIKYVFIFPAAFYTGVRVPLLIPGRRLVRAFEATLVLACLVAIGMEQHPIPMLVHARPAYLSVGLKGTFWEQGAFAFFIGLFVLASLALRIRLSHWPRRRWRLFVVYGLALGCAVASHNKTVWLGLLGAILTAALIYRDAPRLRRALGARLGGSGTVKRWIWRLVLVALILAVALVAYNASLSPGDKIWSSAMLHNKWQNERGAALRTTLGLIPQAPLFGHGFGFVQAYFTTHPADIVGLGAGVADIFNSYLDIWLTSGLIGVAYALGLIWVSFNRRSLISLLLVTYLFICANFNPEMQSEYYYIFLGIAFAFCHEGLLFRFRRKDTP